jgi:hypothetical protein
MIAISRWASSHKNAAIWLVIVIKVILYCLAIYSGLLFTEAGWSFSPVIPIAGLVILLLIIISYEKYKNSYVKRKLFDFSIASISFLSIAIFTNNLDAGKTYLEKSYASSNVKVKKNPPSAKQILESLEHREKSTLTRKEKRILRKEFNVQLKNYVVYSIRGEQQKKEDTGKIILTIVAAVGLLFLLASLVCSLSCNGSDVAAVVIGVLGLTALIWGTIAVIKAIKRKSEAKKP